MSSKRAASTNPYAKYNRYGTIPEHLLFSMSWALHRDARRWTPAGFRWMLQQMFGDLHSDRRDRMERFHRASLKRKVEMYGDLDLEPVSRRPRIPVEEVLRTSAPVGRGPHHPVVEVLRAEIPDVGVESLFLPSRRMLDMFHC